MRRESTEELLWESEERCRRLAELFPDAIAVQSAGKLAYLNAAGLKLLGVTCLEEVLGRPMLDFIHPDFHEPAQAWMRQVEAGRPAAFMEQRWVWPDGRIVDVEVASAPITYQGRPSSQIVVRDVTGRKKMEGELREAEAKYRRLVEQIPAATYRRELGEDTAIMYVSPQIEAMLGYSPEEYVSDPEFWASIIHPDDHERVMTEDARAGGSGERFRVEYRRFARDGRTVWVRDEAVVVSDENGEPLYWQGVVLDITESKLAEQELRRAEAHNKAILDASPDLMFLVNRAGEFLDFRTPDAGKLSVPPEKIVGSRLGDLVPPEVSGPALNLIGRALDSGEVQTYEYQLPVPEGVRDFESRMVASGADEVLAIVRDVTERKRAEAALKESEERHRRQARELSLLHQVRTALAQELDLPVVFRTVVEAIAETYGYTQVSAYLLDGGELMLQHQVGYATVIERVPLDKGVMGRVARTGKSVLLEDVRGEPTFLGAIEGVVSEVCIPLFDEGVVVGTLNVESTDGTRLTEDDLRLISALGEHVGIAIGRARLYTEVRESKERYSSVVDNVKEVIFQTDTAGLWTFLNPAWTEITGFSLEESIGTNSLDYVHPDDRQRDIELFRPLMEREKDYCRHEVRYLARDGGFRWMEVFARLTLASDGTVLGTSGTLNDTTERKQAEQRLEESEQRYKSLYEYNPDAVYSFDLEGNFVSTNLACEALTGYTAEELAGTSFAPLIVPEDLQKTLRHFEKAAKGEPQNYESAIKHKHGHRIELNMTNLPIVVAGEIVGVYGIAKDITERKQAEQVRNRLAAIVESSDDAILSRTRDGVITSWNKGAEKLYGYTAEEVMGRSGSFLYPPEHHQEMPEILEKIGRGERIEHYETVRMTKSGRRVHVSLSVSPIRDISGNVIGDSGIARDITERKALEERLTYQAFHDPLTDLPNRALFLDRLQHALARAGRQMGSIAVLYVDLDNFKIINDSLGHEMGDRVLVEAGRRLRSCLRPADTVARFGGDEFTVLLENNAGVREATWVSERILEKFRNPLFIGEQETLVTPSIGIFLAGPDSRPEEILRNADLAMYRAKEKGKAQYEVFELAMHDRTLEHLKLEADLKQAVERGELRMYYQPKVRLDTGKTIGMEALVRWDRPGLGIILPEEFIPVAEETGLIIPLGQWILEEVCRQGRAWQEQYPEDPPLEVCVNLSARQFQRHDLVEEVAGALRETGLDPRSLILEITESVIMDEAESSITILEALKDLGVQLAIDDFGTGYSSLSYLNRFPVDSLKIDRSFIEGLPEGLEHTAVVSSIITLAHTLGMQVTAEGVETDGQLAQLREIGCDLAQGLCFAEPLAYEAASALLAGDPRW